MEKRLTVQVWSDVACPWCYVGKRRLEAALARFPHRDEVEVVWRAFELDPSAKTVQDAVPHDERLARKYGMALPEARARIKQLQDVAAKDGLDLRFDRVRSTNTLDAHRVIRLGAEHGIQDAVKERLMRAYFTEGEALGDRETLVRLGAEAGLDAAEVRTMLASDAETAEVRADEREARELGISGVPFFVLDGRVGVSGAQSADVLLRALQKTWNELAPQREPSAADATEGATCGPDGCA